MKKIALAKGYRYELVDDVIHILRIYRHNRCAGEYYVGGLVDNFLQVRNRIGEETFRTLMGKTVESIAGILIDSLEEAQTGTPEESYVFNTDMDLISK